MSSLLQFRILFDKESSTYEPGEVVTGKVIIHTTRDKNIKRLYYVVTGSAFVHWLESDSLDDARSRSLMSSEEYFNFRNDILIPNSEAGHKIVYGRSEYTFSFKLPHNIPCSFEHPTGYVRYAMKIVMVRSEKFNHECKTAFSVVSRLDLNAYPDKCCAIDDETSKNFNCLCWIGQGSYCLQIMVPCSGYVPGQVITTTIQYTSTPNIPIRKVSTKLLRRVHFRSSGHTRSHKNVLKKVRHTTPFPENGRIISELLIPAVPPSNLKHCKLIDIDYELVVSAHVSGPYSKIKRSYPLLIGTVPIYRPALARLHSNVPVPFVAQPIIRPSPVSPQGESSASIPAHERENISSDQLDIPSPTYKEGPFDTPNIRERNESVHIFGANIPFSPKYPVYNYPAPRVHNERL